MKYAILIATLILAGCQARLDPAPQKMFFRLKKP